MMMNEHTLLNKIEDYFNRLQMQPDELLDKNRKEALTVYLAAIDKKMDFISEIEENVKEHGVKYFVELLLKEEIDLAKRQRKTINSKLLLMYYLYHTDFNYDYLQ